VEQIVVSAGGQMFTTDQDGDLYLWDTAGKSPPRRIAGGVEKGVVASPDGRLLAWAAPDGRVRIYDAATERVLDEFPGFGTTAVGFLTARKKLVKHSGKPPTVRLWDVESGKERRSFTVVPNSDDAKVRGLFVPNYTTRRAALSRDGKTLAIGPDWTDGGLFLGKDRGVPVRLWDLATGKPGQKLDEPRRPAAGAEEAGLGTIEFSATTRYIGMKSTDGRAFSPDGRFLADWAENPLGPSRMDHVYVWDAATGRAVATLTAGPRPGARNAAFAPDGRTLATASADGIVRLWEVVTWKVRAE